MGSTKTSTTDTKQHQENVNAPPSWTAGGLQQTAGMVSEALGQVRDNPLYTGDFVARPDAGLTDAISQAYTRAGANSASAGGWLQDMAKGFGTSYEGPGLGSYDAHAWGGGTNGEGRLNSALTAAIQPVMRQLQEQILPGIRSSAIDSGAYSGDRAMAVMPGQAITDAMGRANEVSQGLAYEGYQQDQNRDLSAWEAFEQARQASAATQNTAYGLATDRAQTTANTSADLMRQGLQFDTAQGDLLTQAMANQLGYDQSGLDNAMARDQYDTQAPFRGLDIASNLLAQLSGNWGTQTADMTGYSKTTEKTGGLGSIVQGIAGLASGAAGLGLFGPIGTAAGALKAAVPAANIFAKQPAYAGMKA